MRKAPFAVRADLIRLPLYAPLAVFVAIAAAVLVAIVCRIAIKYSFNANEGWDAYWAAVAWSGGDLYPPPSTFKLNVYLPLWFYVTGSLGNLVGDNIIAGRIVAGAALVSIAAIIFLIVQGMTGLRRDGVTAAAAFLAMSGLFFGQYVAANDPQLAANLLMTLVLLAIVRKASAERGVIPVHLVIPLVLLAGLFKHHVIAVPATIAIYLLLLRRAELPRFIAWSIVGLAVVCVALFLIFGSGLFASILYPRPYDLKVAWEQTIDHLRLFGALPAVVAYLGYLAIQKKPTGALLFIYAIVSLIQGLMLSGGLDVDINVFFDFTIACAIGLGLLQNAIARFIADESRTWRAAVALLAWLAITLPPAFSASGSGVTEARNTLAAVAASPQQADVAYIKATAGGAICETLALCYWAGKSFWVDVNTLKILVSAKAQLEAEFIANIERCLYPLIQLDEDWEDAADSPFTPGILAAVKTHYAEASGELEGHYRVPLPNCRAVAGGEIGPAQRLSRPENRSLTLPASAALAMR
jgi:hypothetical protein